jgi:hypothetical protein
LRAFVNKAEELLRNSIHLLIVDLFPPGPRDPGMHKAVWDRFIDNEFVLPADKPLTLAAYAACEYPEAFLEFAAVGARLIDMPLFLTPDVYVLAPLEATYQSAFEGMPAYWREVLNSPPA